VRAKKIKPSPSGKTQLAVEQIQPQLVVHDWLGPRDETPSASSPDAIDRAVAAWQASTRALDLSTAPDKTPDGDRREPVFFTLPGIPAGLKSAEKLATSQLGDASAPNTSSGEKLPELEDGGTSVFEFTVETAIDSNILNSNVLNFHTVETSNRALLPAKTVTELRVETAHSLRLVAPATQQHTPPPALEERKKKFNWSAVPLFLAGVGYGLIFFYAQLAIQPPPPPPSLGRDVGMCWASDELACEATPCFLTVRAAGAQPDARKITATQQAGAMAKAKAAAAVEPS